MPKQVTPRVLTIHIEVDVAEGARLRRGTTKEEFEKEIGSVMRNQAWTLTTEVLHLIPREIRSRVMWSYVWDDVSQAEVYLH